MKTIRMIKLLLVISMLLSASACVSKQESTRKAQVIISYGNHRNVKDMNIRCLNDTLRKYFEDYDQVDINVIVIDGDPYITDTITISIPSYVSDKKKQQLIDDYNHQLIDYIITLHPKTPDVDVFKAFKLASYLADDDSYETHGLFVLDSLLPTKGIIKLNEFNFLSVENADILKYLEESKWVFDMSKFDVLEVYGVAQVDAPQEELSEKYISKLEDLYLDYFKDAGYESENEIIKHNFIFSTPLKTGSFLEYPSVKVIDEEKEDRPFITNLNIESTILDCDLLFEPNSSNLISRNMDQLIDLINKLDKNKSYLLVGTTSSYGNEEDRLKLSEERAATIKSVMVNAGFLEEKLSTYGGSINTPYFTDDRNMYGGLEESIAKSNRRVYILEDTPDAYIFLNGEY